VKHFFYVSASFISIMRNYKIIQIGVLFNCKKKVNS